MDLRLLSSTTITDDELEALTDLVNLLEPTARIGPPFTSDHVRRHLTHESSFHATRNWGLWHDGTLVGLADLQGATEGENTNAADLNFGIHPDHRRHGHGRRLLQAMLDVAAADGRRIVHPWLELTPDSRAFFESVGFDLVFDERISRIDLRTVDGALMQSWVDRATERADGYRLERWVGSCPETLMDAYVEAAAGMNEAPTEGLVIERPTYSPTRLRDLEWRNERRGYHLYVILAVETATGRGAGYTAVNWLEHRPSDGEQWDTATLPAHRNRGLGRWLKAAMWQWMREEHPELHFLETGNADSNEPMLAINAAMGYEPVYHFGGWQHPDVAAAATGSDAGEG